MLILQTYWQNKFKSSLLLPLEKAAEESNYERVIELLQFKLNKVNLLTIIIFKGKIPGYKFLQYFAIGSFTEFGNVNKPYLNESPCF